MSEENRYKKNLEEQQEQELLAQIQEAEKLAKQFMTPQAIQRYGNLKLTHQTLAIKSILIISKAIQTGQLKQKIDDQSYKKILIQIQEPKKNYKILKR